MKRRIERGVAGACIAGLMLANPAAALAEQPDGAGDSSSIGASRLQAYEALNSSAALDDDYVVPLYGPPNDPRYTMQSYISSLPDSHQVSDYLSFSKFRLKAVNPKKQSVELRWKKVKGAATYEVWGTECGNRRHMQFVKVVKSTQFKVSKLNDDERLSRGRFYRFVVAACDSSGNYLGVSQVVHVTTAGGKAKNSTGVSAKGTKLSVRTGKAKNMRKALKLKATGKGVVRHLPLLRYESSNTSVATVDAKGRVRGVGKGRCKVFAYTQNGLAKAVTVTVK